MLFLLQVLMSPRRAPPHCPAVPEPAQPACLFEATVNRHHPLPWVTHSLPMERLQPRSLFTVPWSPCCAGLVRGCSRHLSPLADIGDDSVLAFSENVSLPKGESVSCFCRTSWSPYIHPASSGGPRSGFTVTMATHLSRPQIGPGPRPAWAPSGFHCEMCP